MQSDITPFNVAWLICHFDMYIPSISHHYNYFINIKINGNGSNMLIHMEALEEECVNSKNHLDDWMIA